MEIFTKSAQDTQKLGQKIGLNLTQQGRGNVAKILALYGELGSGKTTFVQGIARGIGLPHRLVSPTFIIIREYPLNLKIFQTFYHVDLYRIEARNETRNLGFAEIFSDPANIVVIEWAERLGKSLPEGRIDIFFQVQNGDRKIIIKENKVLRPRTFG